MNKQFGAIHKMDAMLRLEMWQDRCKNVEIKPGMHVQTQLADENGSEHVWLEVTDVVENTILGKLDVDLVLIRSYKSGDSVQIDRSTVESHLGPLSVGDIVIIKRGKFLGEPVGVSAYVYDTYPDFDHPGETGASIITENGVDLGGFSIEEQFNYLKDPVASGYAYQFTNVIKLDQDFETLIKPLFRK